MAVHQSRQRNLQIGYRIDATVELGIRGVVVDKDVLALSGPLKPPFSMVSSTVLKSMCPSPIAGKSLTRFRWRPA
jgi:hypothetical protein